MKVAIVGASGFIGSAVCKQLESLDNIKLIKNEKRISEDFDYSGFLSGVDVVLYCSGVAHLTKGFSSDYIKAVTENDIAAASNFFRFVANSTVKRIVYISSVNVYGINSLSECPFILSSAYSPADHVAKSKIRIESDLISKCEGVDVVILRCPLVYGKGAKANFSSLINIAKKNLPLPLGAIHNKRSLVAMDNLVDLIVKCIDHPKAANQTFLVSDDRDVSTTELLQMMTRAAGKKPRLIPVPVSWLKLAGKLTGKQAVIDRLCGNLQVDISHTKDTLGWKPPISVEEGIKRCFTRETLC